MVTIIVLLQNTPRETHPAPKPYSRIFRGTKGVENATILENVLKMPILAFSMHFLRGTTRHDCRVCSIRQHPTSRERPYVYSLGSVAHQGIAARR